MVHEAGKIPSDSNLQVSSENRRERASGLTILELGRQDPLKLKCPKNKDQQAWQAFNLLAEYNDFYGLSK